MDDSTGVIWALGLLTFGLVLMVVGFYLKYRYRDQQKNKKTSKRDSQN